MSQFCWVVVVEKRRVGGEVVVVRALSVLRRPEEGQSLENGMRLDSSTYELLTASSGSEGG